MYALSSPAIPSKDDATKPIVLPEINKRLRRGFCGNHFASKTCSGVLVIQIALPNRLRNIPAGIQIDGP